MELHNFLHERNRHLYNDNIFWEENTERKFKKQLYLEDENIKVWSYYRPDILNDFEVPHYIGSILPLESTTLTLWAKFRRKPKFNWHEKLVCIIEGQETIKMVSFVYKSEVE